MRLIVYYVALTLAADLAAVMLCLGIEKVWPVGSLPIFVALYFTILWGAWVLAVRLSEPKEQVEAPAAANIQPAE